MMPFVLHPEAQNELDALADFFLGNESDLWSAFEARYQRCRTMICGNPLLFHERRHQVRRVNLEPRFNEYYIAYRLFGERLVILAVGHAKRRPYYFRSRLKSVKDLL